jgi:hypothetical protein
MDTQQAVSKQAKFEIFVPSSSTFIVTCNGRKVENYRALMEEARRSVEPLIRERWENFWNRLIEIAHCRMHAASLKQLMTGVLSPEMYYPCPPELAEKAIVPPGQGAQKESEGSLDTKQLEALYGPLYRHSEHKIGEAIRFYDVMAQQELTGTIEWIREPGPNVEGGKSHPMAYVLDIVDPSTGMPFEVFPSDVCE